jgi:hypothetical protein
MRADPRAAPVWQFVPDDTLPPVPADALDAAVAGVLLGDDRREQPADPRPAPRKPARPKGVASS